MALWLTLMANREAVGSLVIRRLWPIPLDRNLSGTDSTDDIVGTYLVILDGTERGEVKHRYGDGPWVLVRKALER